MLLGTITALADVAPGPVEIVSGVVLFGLAVAGLFASVAVVTLGVVLVRRRSKNKGG